MSSSNRSKNIVFLMGNIGVDPELRAVPGGGIVCNFSLATAERYKDKSEQWQDATQWHKCEVWGAQAEFLAKYATKGDMVDVTGQIRYRSYEKDGEKRQQTTIRVERVILLGKSGWKQNDSGSDAGTSGGGEDIPF